MLIIGSSNLLCAQKLTTGLYSGTNFSNIRGESTLGKWVSKTGASSGLWFNYAFNPVLSLGTELNHTSIYYQHLWYRDINDYPKPFDDYIPSFYPYPLSYKQDYDFSFFRIPLYLKLSTPTRLSFGVSAGMYFGLLHTSKNSTYPDELSTEFGKIFTAGFSYPVSRNFEIFLQGRYTAGNKVYVSEINGKNGTAEVLLGFGYSGLYNNMKKLRSRVQNDSSQWSIKYKTGMNLSGIKANSNQNKYGRNVGFSSGVELQFALSENAAVMTELLYERKGYCFNDSSTSHYRYISTNQESDAYKYRTDTRIEISYFTLPLLFRINTNGKIQMFMNAGPYISTKLNAYVTGIQYRESRMEGSYALTKTQIYDNIDKYIQGFDWGWMAGGGLQIPLKNGWKIDLEGRYQQGLKNILFNDDTSTGINSEQTFKNRTISVFLGLNVPLN